MTATGVLGKAITIGFSMEGAQVVVAARTETDDRQLQETIYQNIKPPRR